MQTELVTLQSNKLKQEINDHDSKVQTQGTMLFVFDKAYWIGKRIYYQIMECICLLSPLMMRNAMHTEALEVVIKTRASAPRSDDLDALPTEPSIISVFAMKHAVHLRTSVDLNKTTLKTTRCDEHITDCKHSLLPHTARVLPGSSFNTEGMVSWTHMPFD